MTTATNGKTRRSAKTLLAAAAVLAAGLIAFPAPAQARDNHGAKRGHEGPRHGRQVTRHHQGARTYVRVPRRFRAPDRRAYRRYHGGRIYYGPHRHYHEVYRFPIRLNGRIVYQPYAYCGDRVFFEGPIVLPRLAFGLTFGEPGGFYFSGYFGD